MDFPVLHQWDLSTQEAIKLQKQLAQSVRIESQGLTVEKVAACDVSFDIGGVELFAAIAILDSKDFSLIEKVSVKGRMTFPYVPGLLSFRELPLILEGFSQLRSKPDLVICDGQGIAHPRRLGIASHLGLWLQIPTIGCAKSILCGEHGSLGEERGARSPLIHKGEKIGYALRTRAKVSPVFVSPGHLCGLDEAAELVLSLTGKYRHPEPIRYVHNLANEIRKSTDPQRNDPAPSAQL